MKPTEVDTRINRALNGVRQAYRAVIKRVNTSGDKVKMQVAGLADETGQDYEMFQTFGITSNPPTDTEAIVIPLGGKSSHSIIIATENGSYRVKSLAPGEVAIYNQDGAKITLKKGKIIEVDCTDFKVNCVNYSVNASAGASFETPNLKASAQLTAAGQINGNGGMSVSGGTGTVFTGTVVHTGGKFSSMGVVLHLHTHKDSLGGQTGLPT